MSMDERQTEAQVMLLESRLAELEMQLAEQSWERLSGQYEREFSRAGLREINKWARLMFLKNPLIRRGVNVQMLYVFGQGMQVRGRDQAVNDVVQAFMDDAKNQAELTSQQAQQEKEVDLALFGNLYFVFFVNRATGGVRVRTINEDEIEEISCNPEDSKETWFYKRVWTEERLDLTSGRVEMTQRTAFYPDWLYRPLQRPGTIGGAPVMWDAPVYQVKTGGLSDMRFGVSEVYAAIDWAKAYKSFLEDWATLTRAYSRFAHKMTVPGGKAGVAAAKSKMNTTITAGGSETNPPPTVGSMFISQPGVDLSPMRIGGANVSAEDGRRLLLMVSAAFGVPESFFGDVSVGTLATAKSLDRPTELKMLSRQMLWADIYRKIFDFVIRWAVQAPGGGLSGQVIAEDDGTPQVLVFDPETGEELDATVDVIFPSILEHDVDALIKATISAATLDGKALAGTVDGRTVSRLLLTALGIQDVDELVDALYPPDEEPLTAAEMQAANKPPAPVVVAPDPSTAGVAAPSAQDDNQETGDEGLVAEALRGMRAAVDRFVARLEESLAAPA
jgi:hypothetical protein